MIYKKSKIYIAGHLGMVGSAIVRKLKQKGFKNLVFKTSNQLDLRDQNKVGEFISIEKPELIIDAAAVVGGIWANNEYPYKFLMDNMQIQNNLINSAIIHNVENFIFLGSSCIYPRDAKQPIKENYLLTSSLEPTNQWYAIAKITGVKLIEAARKIYGYNYVSLMPTNLYGENDNFDPMTSHVIPGIINKIHSAKSKKENSVKLWGDGTPLREFLHVDDIADAIFFTMQNKLENYLYNVGSEDELSISELAEIVKDVVGFKGKIIWDSSFPNGTLRKKLDYSNFKSMGWKPQIKLKEGIKKTYSSYLSKINE